MRTRIAWWSLLVLGISACGHNALPPFKSLGPVQYSKLEVPSALEVISVDYEAVAYGGGDSQLTARSFLKVFGRHRSSGVLYLLIYERGTGRREPVDVIEIAAIEADTIIGRQRP